MDDEGEQANRTSSRGGPLNHILAHDIANYLTIIRGQTEILLADEQEAEVADRLNTIRRQVIAANAMLQSVGGVARGGALAEFAGVDVTHQLTQEVDRLQSAYPDANITTDIDDGVKACADELLHSVFTNLMENAIKHNESSTSNVHVAASTLNSYATVIVEDDGPGLSDEVQAQLEGRGLAQPQSGIHIVRFLVEKYGGDISVDSSQEGTTITVEIPSASK